MQINTAIMEFRLEISQKLETELPYSPNISLLSIYPESSTVSQRYLYAHVYCCFIHYNKNKTKKANKQTKTGNNLAAYQ